MNTKLTLTTLIAAATLAIGGLAIAQSAPPTSTSGAGCTATANAMRGGNLAANPTNKDCVAATSKAAVVESAPAPVAQAPMVTAPAPAPMAAVTPPPPETAVVASNTRVAKADRN